jgi:hypothetical protein
MNSVSEQIDERILRLLGLQQVFDLDYGTYETLLREVIVSKANSLPQEELALLSNERKRVRGKKGRFKPRSKPITASSLATTKFLNPVVQPISSPIVPSQIQQPTVNPVDLTPLQQPLQSIQTTLASLLSLRKKTEEQNRKDYENENRRKREEGLESVKKGFGTVQNAIKKFIDPFQNIIDNIMKFIFFTLLGKAFNDLVSWLSDPQNKSKVQTLTRFFKDWWPTFVGAAILFLTPFGAFVRGTLRMIGGLTGKLLSQIPRIFNATKSLSLAFLRNPWLAAGAAAVAGTAYAISQINNKEPSPEEQTSMPIQGAAKGGSILPLMPYIVPMASGGMTGYGGIFNNTGQRISGFGVDTQLIAARPGEIVINKETVDAVGAEPFLYLNRQYGGPGANKPKISKLFNSGGLITLSPLLKNSIFNNTSIELFNSGGQVGKQPYGSTLKFRSPIQGYPNYASPKDSYGQFFSKIYRLAKAFGDPFPEVTAAQAVEESGFGKSEVAKAANNLFGQDAPSGTKGYEYFDPIEKRTHNAMVFKSIEESVRYRVQKWRKFYGSAKTPEEAIKNIAAAGYNPHAEYPTKIVQRLREYGVEPNLPSPIKTTTKPKPKSKEKEQEKAWWDPLGLFSGKKTKPEKKQGGGSLIPITNDFGISIKGMGVDTQYDPTTNTALQPGEKIFNYVLTKDSANKGLGNVLLSVAESLQAGFDGDSNAAFAKKIKTPPNIPPHPSTMSNSIEMLSPITQSTSSGGSIGGGTGGPQVPVFFARHSSANNASLYGIG